MTEKKFFEDFEEGFTFEYQVPGLTPEEIMSFARLYDPQRFHLSDAEAAKTHFGGLVASGFQTQLLCFRPFCDQVLLDTWAVGSPGIDSLKWLRPWYPGEDLRCRVKLVEKRLSKSRNDRGYLSLKLKAQNNSTTIFSMGWTVIMLRKGY